MATDLTEIIKLTFEEFDFQKKGIRATAHYHPSLHPVRADRAYFGQALKSLIKKAARTVPPNGELILQTDNTFLDSAFAAAWVIKPGNCIAITITIPGMRLSEPDRQRIFEPFYTEGDPDKAGLSLATVYSIVKKHNGIVTVDDTPQGGTIFTIYLPEES
jgi:signal transduction histidine kinase